MTLCSFKNLTHYEEKLSQIIKIFEMSKHICDPSKHLNIALSTYCSNSMNIIEGQIPSLQQKFKSITHLTGQETKQSQKYPQKSQRQRRGIINGIGTGLKWLFGTPDADDAEKFTASIDTLFSNQRETRLLMQQQVHVLIAAINSYNQSVEEFKRNTETLNTNMREIMRTNAGIVKVLHSLEETTMAIKHVTLLTQLIVQLAEEFDVIINAILFAKQNILHPSIINPHDLRRELLQVQLNSNLQFPIPLDSNDIYLYFDIMKISVALRDNILIYFLRIPTPYREKYGLHHMLPLPKSADNDNHRKIFSFIVPQQPYLLINLAATEFSLLNSLDNCKLLRDYYICQTYTKSKSFADVTCEVQLKIAHLDKIPDDCVTKTIMADMEVWQKINLNEWLYSVSTKLYGIIYCDDSDAANTQDSIRINGTGILRLRPGCRMNVGRTILQAYVAPARNYTHFVPKVDIRTDLRCVEKEEALLKLNVKSITWKNANLDELRYAKHKLETFDQTLQEEINKPYFKSEFGLIYTCAAYVFVGFVIIGVCYYQCTKWGRNSAVSAISTSRLV
ncbi:uncharacterized protein [Atheta coriaria]|uniref:uncharacterized protein n=1 Tax=Dalotia coriaria TaxID=877792 RepID=UPI0031F441BF